MALGYAFLMEFINLCDVQEEKIFFSINRLYRAKIARKNGDIRRRRNVFLSEPNISDRISTDSRARESARRASCWIHGMQRSSLSKGTKGERIGGRDTSGRDFGSRLRLDFAREFDISRSHIFRELWCSKSERDRELRLRENTTNEDRLSILF